MSTNKNNPQFLDNFNVSFKDLETQNQNLFSITVDGRCRVTKPANMNKEIVSQVHQAPAQRTTVIHIQYQQDQQKTQE